MKPKRIQNLMREELDNEFRDSFIFLTMMLAYSDYKLKVMFMHKPKQSMSNVGIAFFNKFIPIDFRNEGN